VIVTADKNIRKEQKKSKASPKQGGREQAARAQQQKREASPRQNGEDF